jgi:hypothetical protein
MEIKLDVTNPVMIQRAREQIEEAEKRAELIKSPGCGAKTKGFPPVFYFTFVWPP